MKESIPAEPTSGRGISRRGSSRPHSSAAVLACVVIAALPGCRNNPTSTPRAIGSPAPPPMVPDPTTFSDGHYYGEATIDGESYELESILTLDGDMRIHIAGPSAPPNAIGSVQFTGGLLWSQEGSFGSGLVIGQDCSSPAPGRFCTETGVGQIRLDAAGRSGEIQVTTSAAEETWGLEMEFLDGSYTWVPPASLEYLDGLLEATLAEFNAGSDTVLSIDSAGRLFFQSPDSGCIGNGTLALHGDGNYPVYDAALTIGACNAAYARLNGEFDGLVTDWMSTPWQYWTDGLVFWLSTSDPDAPQAALTVSTVWISDE